MTHPRTRRTPLAVALGAALAAALTGLPAASAAQTAPPASAAPAAKPAAAPAAKPAAKPSAKPAAAKPAQASGAPPPAADEEQLKALEQVIIGRYECEFKETIIVDRSDAHPGYANLKYHNKAWTMKPVASRTGAMRLEDVHGEMLVVQLPMKSMVLNVRSGQRLVDDCIHEVQAMERRRAAEAPPAAPVLLK